VVDYSGRHYSSLNYAVPAKRFGRQVLEARLAPPRAVAPARGTPAQVWCSRGFVVGVGRAVAFGGESVTADAIANAFTTGHENRPFYACGSQIRVGPGGA